MSTAREIQDAIPRLSRRELEEIRNRIDEVLEKNLKLSDEVKTKLDQSRREIETGQFTIREPN